MKISANDKLLGTQWKLSIVSRFGHFRWRRKSCPLFFVQICLVAFKAQVKGPAFISRSGIKVFIELIICRLILKNFFLKINELCFSMLGTKRTKKTKKWEISLKKFPSLSLAFKRFVDEIVFVHFFQRQVSISPEHGKQKEREREREQVCFMWLPV